MKKLIEEVEHHIKCDIKGQWYETHYGEMPEGVYKSKYEAAIDKIADHLSKIGVSE